MELPLATNRHAHNCTPYISTLFLNISMPVIRQRGITFRDPDPQCLGNASATFSGAFANPHTYAWPDYQFSFR